MENQEKITVEKINLACEKGFLDYLSTKENLNIEGKEFPITRQNKTQIQLFKPNYDLSEVLYGIYNEKKAELSFVVKSQIFRNLGNGDSMSQNIIGEITGLLSKNEDKLVFEISSIHITKSAI